MKIKPYTEEENTINIKLRDEYIEFWSFNTYRDVEDAYKRANAMPKNMLVVALVRFLKELCLQKSENFRLKEEKKVLEEKVDLLKFAISKGGHNL